MNYITGFELVYRKFDETTGELLDTLRTSCGKQVATPGSTRYSAASTSSLILQTKTIAPIMLSVSSEVIGEGVFGVCRKAYLQGTLVCVKELKDKSIQSKSAVLQEAQVLSRLSHPSLCWLIGVQVQSAPFQLVTPYYTVDNIPVMYYDILFNRSEISTILQHCLSLHKDWAELLQDVTQGLKHIHELGLLFKDLKEDNIVLYKAGSERVHAVIIDFGKCVLETTCSLYRLSESERETYRRRHRHVSPELVSGMSKPSTASDVYSLGRVMKHTILYSTVESEAWPKHLQKVCKLCLKESPILRPKVTDILTAIHDCLI